MELQIGVRLRLSSAPIKSIHLINICENTKVNNGGVSFLSHSESIQFFEGFSERALHKCCFAFVRKQTFTRDV